MWILVIEDEAMIADALDLGLRAEGYAVDIAHRGDEGFELARVNDYDAIILDIMLPGLNGYQICRQLREEGRTTPILMLTAKDGVYDEAEGIDTGADDYIVKPFRWVVLLARLRAIIRRSSQNASAQQALLTCGDLQLDTQAHTAQRADTPIDLTPREFAVLEYLMHRQGQAVSKRELLEHVWGEANADHDNVTQVYVGYVRRKVDEPFDYPLIHTIRGIGYKLADRS